MPRVIKCQTGEGLAPVEQQGDQFAPSDISPDTAVIYVGDTRTLFRGFDDQRLGINDEIALWLDHAAYVTAENSQW